jgi:hypothetical protein
MVSKDKGNGKVNASEDEITALLKNNSIDNAFANKDVVNAIRMIIMSDKEIMDNVMRYNIPSKRFAVAAASYIRKCDEHGYVKGIDQIKMQLGLMTSIGEKRINDLVTAVIGERKWQEGQQNGGGGMLKNIANKVYGQE